MLLELFDSKSRVLTWATLIFFKRKKRVLESEKLIVFRFVFLNRKNKNVFQKYAVLNLLMHHFIF